MKNQEKNNKGFSLVELIVVVAIMAVLMGVLVPTLVRNVEKSKKQKDINNLTEIRNAIQVAMASEDYAGLTGTITFRGSSFNIKNDSAYSLGSEPDDVKHGFEDEILANLNGKADYTYKFTSKLKKGETTVVFTLENEKVTGVINPSGESGYREAIQLQDDSAATT